MIGESSSQRDRDVLGMRYRVLACDYDGTLARHGHVEAATLDALKRLKESGRKLILVTGRELPDLFNIFKGPPEIFDRARRSGRDRAHHRGVGRMRGEAAIG